MFTQMDTLTQYLVTPMFNVSNPFQPYSRGDKLVVSELAFTKLEAETHAQAAEQMFRMMNADGRPNATTERSLSVGDVIQLEWFDFERGYPQQELLACDPTGWRIIN